MNLIHATLPFLIFAISAPSAFANSKKINWITPDFFVEEGVKPAKDLPRKIQITADCRATIASKMCLVDPPEGNNFYNRPCLDGSRAYAKPLEDVFDHLPIPFQKMFCSISKIHIEKKYAATAYAGLSSKGPVIGIRKSVLDEDLKFSRWATWKEQLAFGGNQNSYDPVQGLPLFVSTPMSDVSDFVYQVIVHEFGHQFDFANGLNEFKPGCPKPTPTNPDPECFFKEGTWGALSWVSNLRPRPENDFKNRDKFCFYGCEGTSPLTIVPDLYADLYATSFLNAYTSTEAWDDFADSLAYYAIANYLHGSIAIDTAQGQSYNLTDKLYTERFAKKLKFIQDFLADPNIRYP